MKIKLHPLNWTVKMTVGYLVSVALGVLLHYTFQLWPTIITEFLAPVNESIWEHTKVVFWPLLLLLPMVYDRAQRGACLLGALAASLVMLFLGWGYHVVLGEDLLAVDLLIFALVLALGWAIPAVVELPSWMGTLLVGLTVLFVALLLAFTLVPPDGPLFQDATLVDAWVRMTC